jgi:thiamine monophosphate kinase
MFRDCIVLVDEVMHSTAISGGSDFVLCFCVAESANKPILTLPLYLQQAKYSVGFTLVA